MSISIAMKLALEEVTKATKKYPAWPTDMLHAVAVLNEEVGELNKSVLQTVYEPHKTNREELITEAIQSTAMSLRFLSSLIENKYITVPSVQHLQDV